jgi:RNA-splicing ligase RtcB
MTGRTWLEGDAKRLIDEAPDAYKDVESVVGDQRDLAKPLHRLDANLNFKG